MAVESLLRDNITIRPHSRIKNEPTNICIEQNEDEESKEKKNKTFNETKNVAPNL